MQSQERDLITGLFGRLQPFESQPRDSEAEALIKDLASRQPAATYLLVQTVLVQEHALKAAQEKIAELEARANAAPAAPPSFLGSAPRIGPWGSAPATQAPAAAAPPQAPLPSAAPATYAPTRSPLQAALSPQQPAGGGAGGFLRSAMTTAAGVAGGALLFEGIRGLFSGGSGPFGQAAMMQQPPVEVFEQVNNYGAGDNNPVPADFRNNDSGGNYDTAYDDSNADQGYDGNDDMAGDNSSDDDSWA